jgi:exodeoxyribonuclease-3
MKIVTWNCNGALRKKVSELDALDADILVIQECENPAESNPDFRHWAGEYIWKGLSKNKGLGVFPRKGHGVTELNWSGSFDISGIGTKSPAKSWQTEDVKLFLPFTIDDKYTVLGVWTKGNRDDAFAYIGQLWKYIQIHKSKVLDEQTLVMGDFNSNAIWDKPDRWWNHSDVVAELEEIGLHSVYHSLYGEPHGKESRPTLFLQRNCIKPYHVDYIFASADLLPNSRIHVGHFDQWLHISDHMPLSLELVG